MSSDSYSSSTFGSLTSEFSAVDDSGKKCSSARDSAAKSSPQGILPPFYNVCSTMIADELESAFFTYKFPEWIQARIPEPEERIDDMLAGG